MNNAPSLCLLMGSLATVSVHANDNESLEALKQRVALLEAQQENSQWTDRVTISGFATATVSKTDESAQNIGFDDDEFDFSSESKAAVQMGFTINDNAEAVVQLVGRGIKDWDPEFEWAYIAYTFDSGATVRGGRLKLPLFMLSDYREVGYAYPYLRTPLDAYGQIPIDSYDGFDAIIPVETENGTVINFQPFVGGSDIDEIGAKVQNMLGTAVTVSHGNLELRGSYAFGESKLDEEISGEKTIDIEFMGAGAAWDNGDWLLRSEWTRTENDGILPDQDGYYLSVAYRLNEFTPYLVVGRTETQDDDERPDSPSGARSAFDLERTSYALGLRWDFAPAMAVKFDATFLTDFGDTSGGMEANRSDGFVDQEFDNMAVYSLSFDVIF